MYMSRSLVVGLAVAHVSAAAFAGNIDARVTGEDGKAIAAAVVYALPSAGAVPPPSGAPALMIQENQEFMPFVLPIQVGGSVEFPNRDSFRHHVYSFSPAKPFELRLFGGNEKQVVTFDKEGTVALGCNIHDNMLAYIYVVNTPYFATTDAEGKAALGGLPAGAYVVKTWHPNQKANSPDAGQPVTVAADGTAEITSTVSLKRDRKAKKPGAMDQADY
jgi:plastocyanin